MLKEDVIFASPFDVTTYDQLINHPLNCLSLHQLASSDIRMKLKIYAARQENKKMFFDLLEKDPGERCIDEDCVFNSPTYRKPLSLERRNELDEKLIAEYAKEWIHDDKGNKEHFKELLRTVSAGCEPKLAILLAQEIDINATDEHTCIINPACCKTEYGHTILHEACKSDTLSWAVKQLVQCKSCDINAITHRFKRTPLHYAVFHSFNSLKILLTCDGIKINIKDVQGQSPLDCAKSDEMYKADYYLLLACDGIEEQ